MEKLKNVTIVCGDYRESADFIDEYTFVYFDPPYDSDTSTFNSYTEDGFGKEEQKRLAKVFKELSDTGT